MIVDKNANKIRYTQNKIQRILSRSKAKRRFTLKARQFGVSTEEIIDCLDFTIWNKNVTTVIIAHEQDAIKKLFRIVRRAYDNLNPRIQPRLDRGGGSQYEMFFPDINSRIYIDLESRGDTIHRLHISEMAFMRSPDKVLATLQAVPINGEVSVETTPNGMNFFYDMWADSNQPYEKFFFPWFMHHEYFIPTESLILTDEEKAFKAKALLSFDIVITEEQIAWRRFKQAELRHLFVQEYPEDEFTCFLMSGSTVIDGEVVMAMKSEVLPARVVKNVINIYKTVNNSQSYYMGVDTAEGVKGDYSVATVYDDTLEQVAQIRGNTITPYQLAHLVRELAFMYIVDSKYPLVGVERNNHGHAVLLELKENIRYKNLFRDKDGKEGWKTDQISRPIMLNDFIDAVNNKRAKINSVETLNECLTLVVKDNGKIEAIDGKHDDTIIASAIAIQLGVRFKKSFGSFGNRNLTSNSKKSHNYTNIHKRVKIKEY